MLVFKHLVQNPLKVDNLWQHIFGNSVSQNKVPIIMGLLLLLYIIKVFW